MDRRKFVGLGVGGLALLGLGGPLVAAVTAGKEYVALAQPLAVETGDKIEVTEFFWYGCPHCFDLEPLIGKWLKTLPKDVEFRRVPAIFRESWVPGAKTYYALDSLGQLQRLHGEVFDATHVGRANLSEEAGLFDWMASKGIDRKKFVEAYNSFNVQTKVKRAEQLTRQSKIQGVPALIIDGKYMTSGSLTGSHEAMLAATDELIQKARSERKKK
ncbi:MAG: disulfide bond formation protein DsbA [Proteobacteria bacterium]|jgi:thiol:disulfide interchange protein DsbA|nr:disulfide bond formation protein DsbA [Pseudomonadota bacterium]